MSDHETRELAWKLKQANKTMGRQGQTIANLRGDLARTREEHSKIERGELRRMERVIEALTTQAELDAERHDADRAEIARLREKLEVTA